MNRHYYPSEAHTSAVTLLGRGPRPKTVKVTGTSKYELKRQTLALRSPKGEVRPGRWSEQVWATQPEYSRSICH